MKNNSKKILNLFIFFSRNIKNTIAISLDAVLCILALWIAFYLRLDQFIPLNQINIVALILSVLLAASVFWITGLYKSIFRFFGKFTILSIFFSVLIYGLLYASIVTVYGIALVPRSIGILQPIILFFLLCFSRILANILFENLTGINKKNSNPSRTLIYGAGAAGVQIILALNSSKDMVVDGFIDDDPALVGQNLQGKRIYPSNNLELIIKQKKITHVILALPSINRKRRMEIIKKIKDYKVIIRTLPSIIELVDGKVELSDIRELDVEDILNRDIVMPNQRLLIKNIKSQVVMITGAGGSIGSELCKQILKLSPKKMILFDISEYSLYKIQQELEDLKNKNASFLEISIICLLGSVQNKLKIKEILKVYKPDTIYHAAAYKHVPIVEENICEGIRNNVFGTLNLINIALNEKVSNFVFISSDKAVRPTSVMGVSKRISEICLQSLSHITKEKKTNLCIVRFGNVIDSSGSVIPKFKKQIKNGGPVTLTHPDVTRYFMTITEAAQLVLQAGGMARDAEVFILEMGMPIKIKDLIIKMIQLSGLVIQDENNPDGDIAIKLIGLRPGEKLYEELILGDDPLPTQHPSIKQAKDPFIEWDKLQPDLIKLETLLDSRRVEDVINLMQKLVTGYNWNGKIQDQIFLQEQKIDPKNMQ